MLELVLHSLELDVHLESADVRVGVVACASAHGTACEARREVAVRSGAAICV